MPSSSSSPSPSPDGPAGSGREVPDAPRPALRLAAGLVLAEAAVLAALALVGLARLLLGADAGPALAIGLVGLLLAAVLVGGARALARGRGRGLVLTWQLLQGATGVTVLQAVAGRADAGPWRAGAIAALVLAVVVVGLLLTPSATAAAAGRPGPGED